MKKLNDLMEAVMQGATLTGSEALELLEVAKLAAQFTEANDRDDDLAEKLDSGDHEEGEEETLLQASDDADDDYNRTKDALFIACRELLGMPARPAAYPPATSAGAPHPFAQEGCF